MAVVTIWAILVFAGLVIAFGYPLANGLTHLSHRLPGYVHDAAQGHGWIGHLVRRFHLTDVGDQERAEPGERSVRTWPGPP